MFVNLTLQSQHVPYVFKHVPVWILTPSPSIEIFSVTDTLSKFILLNQTSSFDCGLYCNYIIVLYIMHCILYTHFINYTYYFITHFDI